MLYANNVRQLNLAAKTISKFMAEKGTDLPHAEALELASRLIGHSGYAPARATLEQPKGTPSKVTIWRSLAHALGTLTDKQLDMPVVLTEGCDENGNATFSEEVLLLMANDETMAAGTGQFDPRQPLLVGVFGSENEFSDED